MIRKLTFIAMAFVALMTLHAPAYAASEGKMKPFILASKGAGALDSIFASTTAKLQSAGFQIVGNYMPYTGAAVIIVTSDALKAAASKSEFGAYGIAQRVAVTQHGGEIQVAYTNPTYMASAYRMSDNMASVSKALGTALGDQGEFGSEEGLDDGDLRDYHYMFMMPYFDDPNLLGSAKSHQEMVERIEANLAKGVSGTTMVYRIDVPGKEETVFGVGLKGNGEAEHEKDDAWIMSEIDFKDLRSTAHLPIEIVVSGKKAWALDSKFRIAINFSDLSMSGDNSFMNIMGSPGAIQEALTVVSGGKFKGEGQYAD